MHHNHHFSNQSSQLLLFASNVLIIIAFFALLLDAIMQFQKTYLISSADFIVEQMAILDRKNGIIPSNTH